MLSVIAGWLHSYRGDAWWGILDQTNILLCCKVFFSINLFNQVHIMLLWYRIHQGASPPVRISHTSSTALSPWFHRRTLVTFRIFFQYVEMSVNPQIYGCSCWPLADKSCVGDPEITPSPSLHALHRSAEMLNAGTTIIKQFSLSLVQAANAESTYYTWWALLSLELNFFKLICCGVITSDSPQHWFFSCCNNIQNKPDILGFD